MSQSAPTPDGADNGDLAPVRPPQRVSLGPAGAGQEGPAPGEPIKPGPKKFSSPRSQEIVMAARRILEHDGIEALSLRRVAAEIGIRAPSLYKHFDSKASLELALVDGALEDIGEVTHAVIRSSAPGARVEGLLRAYRKYSLSHPHLYKLATAGQLRRGELRPGLETWAGSPWFVVMGDPSLAQALWSFAHGMVVLELDGRYPPGSDLDSTWAAGARAFASAASAAKAGSSITCAASAAALRPPGPPEGGA